MTTTELPKAVQDLAASPVRRHTSGAPMTEAVPEVAPKTESAPVSEHTANYLSLAELVKAEPVGAKGKRVYEVCGGEVSQFVFTNSPAQAALACCGVRTVSQRELLAASVSALKQNDKQK